MRATYKTSVEVYDIKFEVTYSYYPGSPGSLEYPGGPPLEPDDPGEVEILSIEASGDIYDVLMEAIIIRIQGAVEYSHGEREAEEIANQADFHNDCAKEDAMVDKT